MRCCVGDLAIVVHAPADPTYVGTLVHVVCPAYPNASGVVEVDGVLYRHIGGGQSIAHVWVVETAGRLFILEDGTGVRRVPCSDYCLRPIRDNDGADETLINLELTV